MKSTLMLKKFTTTPVVGTMNTKELRTFFGGKAMYTEDVINIDDDTIQFSFVVSGNNYGYQYYDVDHIPEGLEEEFSENLVDLKLNHQTISLLNQNNDNLSNNTRWEIKIKAKKYIE